MQPSVAHVTPPEMKAKKCGKPIMNRSGCG